MYTNATVMKQRQLALSERKVQKANTTIDHVTEVCKIENDTEYVTPQKIEKQSLHRDHCGITCYRKALLIPNQATHFNTKSIRHISL